MITLTDIEATSGDDSLDSLKSVTLLEIWVVLRSGDICGIITHVEDDSIQQRAVNAVGSVGSAAGGYAHGGEHRDERYIGEPHTGKSLWGS